jgi:hypothetical protein
MVGASSTRKKRGGYGACNYHFGIDRCDIIFRRNLLYWDDQGVVTMKLTPLEIAILLEQIKLLMKRIRICNEFKGTDIDLSPLKKLQRKLLAERYERKKGRDDTNLRQGRVLPRLRSRVVAHCGDEKFNGVDRKFRNL